MKKILALFLAISLLPSYAFAITQSLDLESSSSQYASRADEAALDVTGGITMECWAKLESQPSSGTQGMYFQSKWQDGGGAPASYQFRYYDAGTGAYALLASFKDGASSFFNPEVSYSASLATWTHFAVTNDTSGNTKFYINATQQGATQVGPTNIINSSAAFGIGANNISGTPNNFIDGKLSLCRLWSVVRTQAEIDANKCVVLGATTNLQGEWQFDNAYTDNSGNGLTLTAANSPSFSADVPSCFAVATPANLFIGDF